MEGDVLERQDDIYHCRRTIRFWKDTVKYYQKRFKRHPERADFYLNQVQSARQQCELWRKKLDGYRRGKDTMKKKIEREVEEELDREFEMRKKTQDVKPAEQGSEVKISG